MKHEEEPMDDYKSRMKEYISNLIKSEIYLKMKPKETIRI